MCLNRRVFYKLLSTIRIPDGNSRIAGLRQTCEGSSLRRAPASILWGLPRSSVNTGDVPSKPLRALPSQGSASRSQRKVPSSPLGCKSAGGGALPPACSLYLIPAHSSQPTLLGFLRVPPFPLSRLSCCPVCVHGGVPPVLTSNSCGSSSRWDSVLCKMHIFPCLSEVPGTLENSDASRLWASGVCVRLGRGRSGCTAGAPRRPREPASAAPQLCARDTLSNLPELRCPICNVQTLSAPTSNGCED